MQGNKLPTQMLLGLRPAAEPRFENFVAGGNQEACIQIRSLITPRSTGSIYVWGDTGSGKSHLLEAAAQACAAAGSLRRPCLVLDNATDSEATPIRPGTLIIADDVSQLDATRQTLLFRLFNSMQMAGLAFLLSDHLPPLQLTLRDDLRTRMGQSLIFHLALLTDAERSDALRRHALMRGMRLDDNLVQYLLRHARRDLPSLMALLDELDRSSLERKSQPTLPMLRDLMQSQLNLD